MTIRFVLLPTRDNTNKASRLCKFVTCIAVARNSAAATNATALDEKPLKANFNAFPVPNTSAPFKT